MMDQLEDLAAALGTDPLAAGEADDLLRVARDVAHTLERRATPLATFLLGMSVQQRIAAGEARQAAVPDAIAALRAALPPAPVNGPEGPG
ncbi:MAG TPA: DUF6457 domain-containing protein [Actinomycetota bacterium]|jgi:hypothetical protein